MKCFKTISQSFLLGTFLLFYAHTAAAVTIEQTNFSEKETVQPTSEIKLKLDRLPSQKEGRLAIFIGQTDVTSQFRIVGNELIYQSKDFPLPSGETKLIVYLVKENNQWQEIAQLPLKVSTQPLAEQPADSKVTSVPTQSPSTTQEQTQPGQTQPTQTPPTTQEQTQPGQTQPTQSPSTTQEQTQPGQPQPTEEPTPGSASTESAPLKLQLDLKSQLLEERSGNKPNSQRPTFADLTFKADINTGQQRFGDLGIQSKFQFFGSTFDKDPILPTTLLNKNPQNIDLTEYNVNITFGPAALSLGQGNSYGNHPFLLDKITNRGLILSSKLGDRFDISFSSLSATNIIGIDNFLGFTEYDNNITAATLGFQIVKNGSQEGPRGVRLEATWMTGSRKPISNVDEGEVVDAEESDGFGLRLLANDNSNRLRIDGGFARSTFTDPSQRKDNDPTFFYVRRFASTTGGPDEYVAVTCRLSSGARVPLSLTNVRLTFKKEDPFIADVTQGQTPPAFNAEITYNGSGRLRGRWEVVLPGDALPTRRDLVPEASLPIEQRALQRRYTEIQPFDIFLPPTGRVVLPGPDPARLPKASGGLHLVLLRVEATNNEDAGNSQTGSGTVFTGGVAGFPLPVLRYNVSSGNSSQGRATTSIQLLLPNQGAELATSQPISFKWQESQGASAYKLEVESNKTPILRAVLDAKTTSYTAPPWLQEKTGQTLRWRVQAIAPGGQTVAESQWSEFQFQKP